MIDLAQRILRMFYAWPTVRLDDDKAVGVAETYAAQLSHLPVWAVVAGILDVQGRKMPFPPSAGELRAACEAKMIPVRDEMLAIGRIIDAEVYTPTPRGEDAKRRVREVADGMKGRFEKACSPPKRDMRLPSAFDAAKAHKIPDAPMLSNDLRRRMGLPVEDHGTEVRGLDGV